MAGLPYIMILWGLLLTGLASGFLSSTPLGPINLYVANMVASRHKAKVHWLIAGVIAADLGYAGIAFFGFRSSGFHGSLLTKLIGVGGGLFLVALGLLALRALLRPETGPAASTAVAPQSKLRAFALGAFLCGSNPCFLLFWLSVLRFIAGAVPVSSSLTAAVFFLAGVALGDSLWFLLITRVVDRHVGSVRPKLVTGFRYATAWAFIGLGGFAVAKSALLLPLDDARQIAAQLEGGDAETTELALDDGHLVFAVNVVRPIGGDGLFHKVLIDVLTGEPVRVDLQTPEAGLLNRRHAILVFKSPRKPTVH